jgi:hypothetical protein
LRAHARYLEHADIRLPGDRLRYYHRLRYSAPQVREVAEEGRDKMETSAGGRGGGRSRKVPQEVREVPEQVRVKIAELLRSHAPIPLVHMHSSC